MLTTDVLVTHVQVKRTKGGLGYAWKLTCDGVEYVAYSDTALGSIMTAFREILRMIAEDHGQTVPATVPEKTGDILIEHLSVERTTVLPGYQLVMGSGPYTYEAYVDLTLESWIAGMSGAMKFFAVKYGLIYLYDEVVRNVDRAHEEGFEA
jgi:hypothetical protein